MYFQLLRGCISNYYEDENKKTSGCNFAYVPMFFLPSEFAG